MCPPIKSGLDLWGVKIISSALVGLAARPFRDSQPKVCSNPCIAKAVAVVVVLETLKMAPSSM